MKKLFCFLIVALFVLVEIGELPSYGNNLLLQNQQQVNDGSAIIGIWLTEKKDTKIQIYPQNGNYYGKIIWTLPEYQQYNGSIVIKAVSYNASNNDYICPWIYSPRLNIDAHAIMSLSGNDILDVKIIKGIITSHQVFSRVK